MKFRNLFFFLLLCFYCLYFDNLNIFKICLLSSFAHETGHIAVYIILLNKVPKIEISIFGIKMINDIKNEKHLKYILARGPGVNLFLTAIFYLLCNNRFTIQRYTAFGVNLIMFIFNMLPVYYLDGGQILYITSKFYQNHCKSISILTVIFIGFIGIAMCLAGQNYGIIRAMLLFIVYFILNLATD